MEKFIVQKQKSFFFKFAVLGQLLLMILLFIDGYQLFESRKMVAWIEITAAIIGFLATTGMYFLKKVCVYFYAIVLLVVLVTNPMKSDIIFTTFFFIGVTLPIIIPRWESFK